VPAVYRRTYEHCLLTEAIAWYCQVPYRGLPWGTVVYSVGVGGSALPIPSSCPVPFRDLLVKCAEKEPTSRPGFGRIVTILQDIRGRVGGDRPTGGAAWKAMQVHWKAEMEGRFLSLKQSEKVNRWLPRATRSTQPQHANASHVLSTLQQRRVHPRCALRSSFR
jgi:mitogen-activated protein kinase kinase kinase 9